MYGLVIFAAAAFNFACYFYCGKRPSNMFVAGFCTASGLWYLSVNGF